MLRTALGLLVAAALGVGVPRWTGRRGAAGLSADPRYHRSCPRDADRGRDRIRRDAEVAALDDHPAADRRADHADLREVGRPRPARARRWCRSIRAASRRRCRARKPSAPRAKRRSRSRGSRPSARSELFAAGAISQQELEQAETALRTAEAQPAGAERAGAAAASPAALLHRHRADRRHRRRRAGPRRQPGHAPDRADDDRSERDARGVRVGAGRTRGALAEGAADRDPRQRRRGQRWRRRSVDFISPRVDDQTQSVLVKGQVQQSGRPALRSSQYVRARIVWKTGRGAGRAGDGGAAHQRPVLRVRRRGRRRQAGRRSSGRSRSVRSPATTIRCSTGIKAGERVVVSGVQKLVDGAPIQATARPPSAPSRRPQVVTPCLSILSSAVRFWRACARWSSSSPARSRSRRCRSRSFPSWRRRRSGGRLLHRRQRRDRRDRRSRTPLEQAINGVEGMHYMTSTQRQRRHVGDHGHVRHHPQPRPRRRRRAEPHLPGRRPAAERGEAGRHHGDQGVEQLRPGRRRPTPRTASTTRCSSATTSIASSRTSSSACPGVGDVIVFGERPLRDAAVARSGQAGRPRHHRRRRRGGAARAERPGGGRAGRAGAGARRPDVTRSASARSAGSPSRRSSTTSS